MARFAAIAACAALLLVAAAVRPAAAVDCKKTIKTAIDACKGDLTSIAWAIQSGGSANLDSLTASKGCCNKAKDVYEPAFMNECGCDADVLKQTSAVIPAVLVGLQQAVGAKCGVVSPPSFPSCTAEQYAAAQSSLSAASGTARAAAVGPSAREPKTVRPNITDPNLIKSGPNSSCSFTSRCAKYCFNVARPPKNTTLNRRLNTWYRNTQRGFCSNPGNLTNNGGIFTFGSSVCGSNSTTNGPLNYFTNTTTKTSGRRNITTQCYYLCQSMGSVFSDSRNRWYDNVNLCSKAAAACFPGAATVTLPGGAKKAMRDLAVGDRVMVLKADGSAAFEDVYFFDHQVDGGSNEFVRLALTDGRALELSSGHFVPVGDSLAAARMTRARDVTAGATVLVMAAGGKAAEPVLVDAVSIVHRAGLFAPVTSSGTVVVDGVVASTYSDWALDPLFDALGLSHKLHAAMHVVHAPLRLAYAVLGRRAMAALSPIVSGVAMLDTAQIAAGLGMAVSA